MDETSKTNKNYLIKFLIYSLKITKLFLIISFSLTLFYRFVPVAYTPLMVWRSVASIFTEDSMIGINKTWVPIENISKSMQQSVIKAEDYKFYQHFGFDFEAIEKAVQYNKTHKKKKGASTITQQTAKNVFLWPSRSWLRKGLEAYFTVLIEVFWPKERILEVYLNVIELGKGVYGVEAASKKYFKKPAKKLNNAESALMAAVLPNPIRFRVDKPSAYIYRRQRKILGRKAPPLIADIDSKDKGTIVGKISNIGSDVKKGEATEENSQEFFSIKFDNEDETAEESSQSKKVENNEESSSTKEAEDKGPTEDSN